ncbi:GNAT family N-acetyltransferase [Cohaesibacter gelatinilyticus]|uniref:Putative acetyltransferase n=1 Tax=Cohaesibacter gelatinilyticus TaxID=372072 RepID=A0A285NN66_9HYPH|nr:GNAT family N-acetyltransferase [Cohaesibacter gelatinilyticus]SNZ09306.1 putative acetyltransferase [Cohaesibacter gelatinilyticus]
MAISAETPSIIYRRSKANDRAAVFSLISASTRDLAPIPYSQEVVDSWMHGRTIEDYRSDCEEGLIWIAEIDEQAIGFSHGEPGEVKRLFVDADFTGYGVGAALMKLALEDARSNGTHEVIIEATLNAVPFYKKWGFIEIGDGMFPGRENLPPIKIIRLKASFS